MKARWGKRRDDGTGATHRSMPFPSAFAAASRGDPSAQAQPLLVAVGLGGHIELMHDHIVLIKNQNVGNFINILGLGYGKVHKSIMIDDISSVSIIRPMVFPDFIRFTYPGSPISAGNAFGDAMKENALIMNLMDNRAFYELKELIHVLHQQRNDRRFS